MSDVPTLYAHQRHMRDFTLNQRRSLCFSDPGTGKTAAQLDAIRTHREQGGGRALVVCPKAIMGPAWANDAATFTPDLTVALATAPADNRRKAFRSGADIVVLNHDGATWLDKNLSLLEGFDFLVIDESTAFKNKNSQRSKAMARIAAHFDDVRTALTGTPRSNNLLDVWHQVYLIDDGEHLGSRYYAFRSATHEPIPVTMDIKKWVPKDGADEVVMDMIAPITIRYTMEECVDMPERQTTTRYVSLSRQLRKYYDEMEREALLELEEGEVEAVHAASLMNKLQQIASGSVYDVSKSAFELNAERYELIASLCAERDHSLVAFQWRHQRDGVIHALERAGVDTYAVIDGETKGRDIDDIVTRFQAGEYQTLLIHPQSAGHGLTLTRANTLIWASPTPNAELFEQANRRIYRTGQQRRTETIIIAGKDTVDERILDKLYGRVDAQASAFDLLHSLMPSRQQAA